MVERLLHIKCHSAAVDRITSKYGVSIVQKRKHFVAIPIAGRRAALAVKFQKNIDPINVLHLENRKNYRAYSIFVDLLFLGIYHCRPINTDNTNKCRPKD